MGAEDIVVNVSCISFQNVQTEAFVDVEEQVRFSRNSMGARNA